MRYIILFIWALIHIIGMPIFYALIFSFGLVLRIIWTFNIKKSYGEIINELGHPIYCMCYATDKHFDFGIYYKYCYPNSMVWYRDAILNDNKEKWLSDEYLKYNKTNDEEET